MISLVSPVLALLTGLAFGWIYFALVRRTALLFAAGGRIAPALLAAARLAAALLVLGLAARLGALMLLSIFAGFLTARVLALHLPRRAL